MARDVAKNPASSRLPRDAAGNPEGRPPSRRPVLLVVLDGWGLRAEREANAVELAATPVYDRLRQTCPHTMLHASGRSVGLPEGQMGNSEVGHLTIGAGRVLLQDITRIDGAIASGEFYENPVLVEAFEKVRAGRRPRGGPCALHVMGLLSDGGVHSHMNHCFALLELARRLDFREVLLHAFTDGRDASPTGGAGYLRELQRSIERTGVGILATVLGRYWAMDRDRRWERTRVAYDALMRREGRDTPDPVAALEEGYRRGETDEFVRPLFCNAKGGIEEGDGVIFFNFRADRARQLMRALVDPTFAHFPRVQAAGGGDLLVRDMVTMARYGHDLRSAVAFPREDVVGGFGETVARAGLRQLRVAETEKYAHVTYFFNGGLEEPLEREERLLIPSPKVATYDLKPEMSAPEVTDRLIEEIRRGRHDVFVLNYANPDMVGHTGSLEAAIAAVEAVDRELGRLLEAFPGTALVIADHGNAETMRQADGSPHTAHTTNPVPCILVGGEGGETLRDGGSLQDVAPTLLGILGLEAPAAMKGRDLRRRAAAAAERLERVRPPVREASR
jgi:2,3-bisphosphoglycerate-independent phosphoglycerate mutase